ncbi:MAG TPA: formyl transferase [Pseudolabrys sp.]|nr:formyl transferase [Pseudolabrys sp.]
MNAAVVLMGVDGPSTRIVYNRLSLAFGALPAIIERPISRRTLLRIRARKLGWLAVASQMAFMLGIRPVIQHRAKKRIERIKSDNGLDTSPIPDSCVSHVESVNSPETIGLISKFGPKVIVVNGTRIISAAVLNSTQALFINTHAGITPKYRGAHGAYWALYNDDPGRCGVTVHLVDSGIDTGAIVEQALISPTREDSFVTYPYLQIAAALPILIDAVRSALDGTLKSKPAVGESAVWYHPGAFAYLRGRLRGVR